MAAPGDNFAFAAQTLRALDRRRYFATLILPEKSRRHVQALYAFAAEIEAVRHKVSEPGLSEIRLRWWRDMLEGRTEKGEAGPAGAGGSPLALALLDTLATCGLDPAPLCRLIEARRFDLYRDPMPDLTTFEGYAGETVSVLLHMAATILHGASPPGSAEVAGHLGVALVLADELSRLGFNLSRGHLRLPLEIFVAEGLSENELLAGTDDKKTAAGCRELAAIGRGHLEKAQAVLADVPGLARLAFAPVELLKRDLTRLERRTGPVLAPPRLSPDWLDIFWLALWAWKNRGN